MSPVKTTVKMKTINRGTRADEVYAECEDSYRGLGHDEKGKE